MLNYSPGTMPEFCFVIVMNNTDGIITKLFPVLRSSTCWPSLDSNHEAHHNWMTALEMKVQQLCLVVMSATWTEEGPKLVFYFGLHMDNFRHSRHR